MSVETLKMAEYTNNYSQVRDLDHAERVLQKTIKVQTLSSLLQMHEEACSPDYDYIKGLRRRLRLAQAQLRNMRP